MIIELRCRSETDTRAAGGRLASLCRPGDLILLCGPLGAGKTVLVGGIADGLGVEERVVSPTFVLVRRYYTGFLPLIHADVYRLASAGEFADLDLFDDEGVVVIEWGEAVATWVPADHLRVEMTIDEGGTRLLRLVGSGSWNLRPLREVAV